MIRFRNDVKPALAEIFAKGVPAFPVDVDLCSPTNSSPYTMNRADLSEAFKEDTWRLQLLQNVDDVLEQLAVHGIAVPAFLIGGGFVRRLKDGSRPSDIDGVAFYRMESATTEAMAALKESIFAAKNLQIDMRICPLDANPIVAMKAAIFYSVLFSKARGGTTIENGLILYDREQ